MTDRPKKTKGDPVPPILKTSDELMDDLFSPEVRKALKDQARKARKTKDGDHE